MCSDLRQFLIITIIMFTSLEGSKHDSFSFFKFSGPVSGEIEQIYVSNGSGGDSQATERKIDYIAKPDYSFHYGVQDTATGNSQGHKESREGDSVTGEYRVLQDDGLVRIVRYTASPESGFQVRIEYVRLKQ